jgi:hypothetical protein
MIRWQNVTKQRKMVEEAFKSATPGVQASISKRYTKENGVTINWNIAQSKRNTKRLYLGTSPADYFVVG